MAEQRHRATHHQWAKVKDLAERERVAAYSTILELLHRIEALEAAQQAKPNHPEKLDSSLVKGVAAVIDNGTACDRDSERIASDTIRAVAAWLLKHYGGQTATTYLLEQEAER